MKRRAFLKTLAAVLAAPLLQFSPPKFRRREEEPAPGTLTYNFEKLYDKLAIQNLQISPDLGRDFFEN